MKIETIFAFVRFAINDKATVFDSSDELDWEVLYEFAKKQTIVGVMYAGIEKLSKEQRPPKSILMNWYMLAERIRKRNDRLNEAVIEVTSQFERDGFPNCVLKGQGNALMYPDPSLRQPGDIDLWPLAERKDIFKYVRRSFPDTEMLYHHLEYPIIKDVMTEVHFFPMFLNNPLYNRRFQKWMKSVAKQQCENRVELPQGSFCRPTDDFNVVYQLAHVRHHFFDEGIGMRQLLDYYYLLKSETVVAKHEELRHRLKDMGLLGFAGAGCDVCHERGIRIGRNLLADSASRENRKDAGGGNPDDGKFRTSGQQVRQSEEKLACGPYVLSVEEKYAFLVVFPRRGGLFVPVQDRAASLEMVG